MRECLRSAIGMLVSETWLVELICRMPSDFCQAAADDLFVISNFPGICGR